MNQRYLHQYSGDFEAIQRKRRVNQFLWMCGVFLLGATITAGAFESRNIINSDGTASVRSSQNSGNLQASRDKSAVGGNQSQASSATSTLSNTSREIFATQQEAFDISTSSYLARDSFQTVELVDIPELERGSCSISNDPSERPRYFAPVNKEYNLEEYVPPHLVEINALVPVSRDTTMCLDETATYYLALMLEKAEKEGEDMAVTSAYRSKAYQEGLYERSIERNGDQEIDSVAEGGHSEHQLGTTVDLTSAEINYLGVTEQFSTTGAYQWLLDNAHTYGFVESYPAGSEDTRGYIAESWHWRFVGPGNAHLFAQRIREGE